MNKKWVACISQTGSELYAICKVLQVKPAKLIVTNKDVVIPKLWNLGIETVIVFNNRPSEKQLIDAFEDADIITLHGYLYIIPSKVCGIFKGKIFNGHPGLITKYPELVGKDPQIRAWGKYPTYGCVLHEVIAEVDKGEIIDFAEISANSVKDLEELFILLKALSANLWISFLREKLEVYLDEQNS